MNTADNLLQQNNSNNPAMDPKTKTKAIRAAVAITAAVAVNAFFGSPFIVSDTFFKINWFGIVPAITVVLLYFLIKSWAKTPKDTKTKFLGAVFAVVIAVTAGFIVEGLAIAYTNQLKTNNFSSFATVKQASCDKLKVVTKQGAKLTIDSKSLCDNNSGADYLVGREIILQGSTSFAGSTVKTFEYPKV
jgi:hypothetical protein